MKISYRWLQAVAPGLKESPDALAARLASLGAPVEDIEDLAAELGEVVIGRVVAAGPHPNADRLSLCQVDGGDGVVDVVCGAPNVKEGAFYPFAPVGATIPGGFKLKRAKIRGEYSNGMLCSEKELGLGRDHAGIMELQGDFTPGEPFVEAVGLTDWRLDVEVTANRGDLLSHVGVAREVAPGGVSGVELPSIPGSPGVAVEYVRGEGRASAGPVEIEIADGDLCPRYLGAVIRGVKVGPSPEWLVSRLRAVGARPINNVVDATNYVLLESGQPLHAFDLGTLEGSRIVVRRARKGERLVTLDDVDRALGPDMLMICDDARPVAVAGVMGGGETEVSDATTDVLLECALFHPGNTRATRRDLQMSTDASYRFERGVDPEGMETALERVVEIILATAGGSLDGPVIDARVSQGDTESPLGPEWVALRPARVERLLGVPFAVDRIRTLLQPLGFQVEGSEGEESLRVRVPGFRRYDVRREVDLIEEIARTHGYDAFPAELNHFRPGTVADDELFRLQDRVRDLLVARGFLEAQTPAFSAAGEGRVEVLNPVSAEEGFLRAGLLAALLRRVGYNFARGTRDVRLFETGTVFSEPGEPGAAPLEEVRVCVVATGGRAPAHWASSQEPVDFWDLKGWAAELGALAWSEVDIEPAAESIPEAFEPARTVVLRASNGREVGWAGLIRSSAVDAPAWAGDVWGLEVALPEDPAPQPPPVSVPPPAFPSVERDFAVVVPLSMAAAEVEAAVRLKAGKHLAALEIFDVYEGEGIPEGTRSIAFRLRFRSPERTLTDKEVDRAAEKVMSHLKEVLGVDTRGR
jgi:phenylalanyl-tRNA synthetase beta chain